MTGHDAQDTMQAVLLKSRFHHAPGLAKLHAAEWRHLYAAWDERIVMGHFATERADGAIPTTLLAVDEDDGLLGSISLLWNDLPGREDLNPWVGSLLVRPAHRGRGAGRFLLQQAETLLYLNGQREAYVFTENAQRFFERHGWSRVDEGLAHGRRVNILRKTGLRGR